MSIRGFLAVCALMIGFLTTSARADVVYTFSGTDAATIDNGLHVGFTFTSPGFLPGAEAAPAVFPCTNCTNLLSTQVTGCPNCLVSSTDFAVVFTPNIPVGFNPDGSEIGDSQIQFNDLNGFGTNFLFSLGVFAQPGTYNTLFGTGSDVNSGTLTVSVVNVPEPDTISLAVGGMMLTAGCFFYRKRAAGLQLA